MTKPIPRQVAGPAREICAIGRRLYQRGLVAASEGNISCRLGTDRVLCTPTMISKGQMRPADLCIVGLDGRQIWGGRAATSELQVHLELYRARADIQAVVHAHPPHATAFAVTPRTVPPGILPEFDIFLRHVPIVPYVTPGTLALARKLRPHAMEACVAILKNHGAVSWDRSLERALWWMEMLDAYCRVLLLARPLGSLDSIPPINPRSANARGPRSARAIVRRRRVAHRA